MSLRGPRGGASFVARAPRPLTVAGWLSRNWAWMQLRLQVRSWVGGATAQQCQSEAAGVTSSSFGRRSWPLLLAFVGFMALPIDEVSASSERWPRVPLGDSVKRGTCAREADEMSASRSCSRMGTPDPMGGCGGIKEVCCDRGGLV
jgi:hypothetical protein